MFLFFFFRTGPHDGQLNQPEHLLPPGYERSYVGGGGIQSAAATTTTILNQENIPYIKNQNKN